MAKSDGLEEFDCWWELNGGKSPAVRIIRSSGEYQGVSRREAFFIALQVRREIVRAGLTPSCGYVDYQLVKVPDEPVGQFYVQIRWNRGYVSVMLPVLKGKWEEGRTSNINLVAGMS